LLLSSVARQVCRPVVNDFAPRALPGYEAAMSRYYLHVHTAHGTLINDDERAHQSDVDAACEQARVAARSLSEDADLVGCDYSGSYFEIASESDVTIPAYVTASA
jgi:hypothetical protein